jgi:outer membrane lipoprotein SlyB
MKKLTLMLLIASSLMLSGCKQEKVINGTKYEAYGLANEDAKKDPNVVYEISAESVIVAIILSETIVVPIYVLGWDLYKPVKLKVLPAKG